MSRPVPPHESAHLHVTGSAPYVDDLPELAGTLHCALGLSPHAHARIAALDLEAVRAAPGVRAVLTAADIPAVNDCGAVLHDEPILADGEVHYLGQPVFAVIADTREQARHAARLAAVDYAPRPAVLDPLEAHRRQSWVLPPLRLARGDAETALAQAPLQLAGRARVGAQEHFYLEGQIAYAWPTEDGGLHLHSSTQHPSEMQHAVAAMLGVASHRVRVEVRRMGGGFGGKEAQSAVFACIASLAANRLQRPVKLRPDRDDDMLVTGKRHAVHYDWAAGFGADGLLHGVRIDMVLDAGWSADLSGPVATRAVCHVDNAYYLPAADISACCAHTNRQSSTAFRGFGGPQGAFAIERILDDIAYATDLDPLDVRKRNFYAALAGAGRDTTPYGQAVADNVIHTLVAQLEADSDYRARRAQIAAFNAGSPVIRKGLALTPVKFGISFNLSHLNQAGALVHVYTDGSVLVNHGGTEMGQGLNTKVAQVVAHTLGVPLARVRCTATDTGKVANTSATAASSGSDLNGKAAEAAARRIRDRLAAFAAERSGVTAADVVFADDQVQAGAARVPFARLVREAYVARLQLWSDGFYATPGLHWDARTLTGHPFYYFAYGAAVSEVAVDTLTGEWTLLRADLLHDAGRSINPAIDRGQVEGGFMQGLGWLTLEELVWNDEGRLLTHAPSTYKIPAVHDCPPDFRVRLFDNANREDTILRSKAVGEPPLLLAFSVFFAIRDALGSLAGHRVAPPLDAPATPEAILRAADAMREIGGT
ncbi:xanthine dehydrogenase molybdopterin binding subunit [Thauera propionica]|uniref:xanthine dehydrogenase molybdopterin binding subunit n=1 Tax=Thauera propionica TaxID=2019431 RepID=UPI0023F2A3A2|nr:xanthine dehydrogenase molybdopterin binding subunit [Thauera propionica]MDD3675102.1 xanthine dehydrogenase molybdopterin binding subunit [Thauera propionica]